MLWVGVERILQKNRVHAPARNDAQCPFGCRAGPATWTGGCPTHGDQHRLLPASQRRPRPQPRWSVHPRSTSAIATSAARCWQPSPAACGCACCVAPARTYGRWAQVWVGQAQSARAKVEGEHKTLRLHIAPKCRGFRLYHNRPRVSEGVDAAGGAARRAGPTSREPPTSKSRNRSASLAFREPSSE